MINNRAQAREHEQSKRIRREEDKERKKAHERSSDSASTGSWQRTLRSGIVCIFFVNNRFFILSVFLSRKAGTLEAVILRSPNYQSVFQFAQFVWSLLLCLSSEAI